MKPPLPPDLRETVKRALQEDVGSGDVTACLLPAQLWAEASVICREQAVLCGCAWFTEVFRQLDPRVAVGWLAEDGADLGTGQELCRIVGPARAILTAERTALNFLQTLSGTATTARRYARALEGLATTVLDTRKTLPCLRSAQKFAVAVGGCRNHRLGLYDGVLIKENHILALGSLAVGVGAARARWPELRVEVEAETLAQVEEAAAAGADIVLLDNFDLAGLREAVAVNRGRAKLEASGGIELSQLRAIAATGVDYISVGALTKHLRATDLSLRFLPTPSRNEALAES
jgi:nicotinate-nucleotide pyrophosphorylase (carboxylating)